MNPAGRVRVGVVGVGHLGRFHARIYAEHPLAELVFVFDLDRARAEQVAAETGTRALSRMEDLPGDVHAVSIAVPTRSHASVATPLLERGVACLIEKPLAEDIPSADRILEAARRGGALLTVGHVERFQPGLRRLLASGVVPRFIECHRLAPFSFRSTDIGVVHDLMIHDLDLVLHLMGGVEVSGLDAAGGSILTEREDLASVRLVFANGARANVTASRVSLEPMRRFRIFSSEAYASLDFHKNYGLFVRKGPNWNEGRRALQELAGNPSLRADLLERGVVLIEELEFASELRPLQAELDSFLRAVLEGSEPVVSGADGRRALDLAERISAEIELQGW
jgi:predicted dehydrogenase